LDWSYAKAIKKTSPPSPKIFRPLTDGAEYLMVRVLPPSVPVAVCAGLGWAEIREAATIVELSHRDRRTLSGVVLAEKLHAVRSHAQSELRLLSPAELDQPELGKLTGIDAPVLGAIEQNIFYVNQIMKFGKFFAVFQAHPSNAEKTVVTAFMVLAIKASVLDERRAFEKVPVLRNLVPAQVLMGQSSFNSGASISAGLPKYARNEIKTVASLLQTN